MSKTYVKVIFCLLFALACAQEEETSTVTNPSVICSLIPDYPISDFPSPYYPSPVSCDCEFEGQVQGGYYFDATTQQCAPYFATCCTVVSLNSFATLEDCQNTCQGVQTLSNTLLNPFTICGNAPAAQPSDATSSVSVYSFNQSTYSCQEMNISDSESIEGQNLFQSLSICQQFCESYIYLFRTYVNDNGCECEFINPFCDSVSYNSLTGVCTIAQTGCCGEYVIMSITDEANCHCENNEGETTEYQADPQTDFALADMGPITCDCIFADPPCFATFDATNQECTIRVENCCEDEVSSFSATDSELCVCPDN